MRSFRVILSFIFLLAGINFAYANTLEDIVQKYQLKPEVKHQIDVLADSCWNLREEEPEAAIALGKIGLNLASAGRTEHRVNELYNYIGAIYLNYLHDISNAVPYFEKAYNLCLASGDSIQLAYAYNNLGDLYYITNNLPLAIKYDTLSYNLFRLLNFKRGVAYSITNLGEVYLAQGNYEKAIQHFQELNELETSLQNLSGISFSLLKLGLTYLEIGDYDQSLNYLNQSYKLTQSFQNRTFKASCLTGLANLYIVKQDWIRAENLLNQSLALNTESEHIPGIINNKMDLALLYSKTGKAAKGEKYVQEAEDLAFNLGFPAYITTVERKKVDFYTNLKDSKSVIRSYEQYFTVYDSLYRAQGLESLHEMQKSLQSQFSLEKMKDDLDAKKKERTYLFIIIVLLFALGLLFFWRYTSISSFNKKLKESNTTKDKLFSIVAHDLKSPFGSIIGMCELMSDSLENKDYEKVQKYGKIIDKTASETYNLITNLLSWSKSQLSEIKLNAEPIRISTFIDEIIELYFSIWNAKAIHVNNHIDQDVILNTDKNSLSIVISNLLTNALKFTHRGGTVEFLTRQQEGYLQILVRDSGVGIPDAKMSSLFDIAENESTLGTGNEKGTGLGLVLCKQFVEKNGGRLKVESKMNKGSTFIVELPLES